MMKFACAALIGVALLLSVPSYSVGEGPWECLWGSGNCGSVFVSTTESLETCMESPTTTSCTLRRGVYSLGGTTLDIAVDSTLGAKSLVCELGTIISGTGSPVVKVNYSGTDDYVFIQGCIIKAATTVALEVTGDPGRIFIDQLHLYSAIPVTPDLFGTLNESGDLCDTAGFKDANRPCAGVTDRSVVWLDNATTGKDIVTGVEDCDSVYTVLYDPDVVVTPSTCTETTGTITYKIFHNFSALHLHDTGNVMISDSVIEGGAFIHPGGTPRLRISDSYIAAADSDRTAPCLSVYAGTVEFNNVSTVWSGGCPGGANINAHTIFSLRINGGGFPGTLRFGDLHDAVNPTFSGAHIYGMTATEPALHMFSVGRVSGDINVQGTMATGFFDLITGDTGSTWGANSSIDLKVSGDNEIDSFVAGDILADEFPDTLNKPDTGCIRTGNAQFDITTGTVTRQTCEGDLNQVTSGTSRSKGVQIPVASGNTTIAACTGQVYDNTGQDGGTTRFDLPAVSAGAICSFYQTSVLNGATMDIHPYGTNILYHPVTALGAGECFASPGVVHSFITFYGVDSTNWSAVSYQGAWADDGDCG